jgi:rfaE bifunctional protein nucleotidyltransferase chain/domain
MGPSEKICAIDDLARRLEAVRSEGRRIVLCHGVFDILHPGHILHLKEARTYGDYLVVTVTPDRFVRKGPGRPVFNERLRMETLAALEYVDSVALNEWPTAIETLGRLRPHIYAKGKDYADSSADVTRKILDEEAAVKGAGGEIRFTSSEIYSSSHLANRFFSAYPQKTQEYLAEFRKRHTSDEIIGALESLADLRVLIVGEAILDRYTYCLPLAKSPKEFIVASRFQSEESFAGGALATANHLAGFCKQVTLLTALGPDKEEREFIREKMRTNVDLRIIEASRRSTIVKRRFIEPNFLTKMFELQYLDDTPFGPEDTARIEAILQSEFGNHDLIISADFGHGMITPPVMDLLSRSGKFLAVNTQTNSANLGFNPITRYKKVDFACIDEPEIRLATRAKYDDLRKVGSGLREQLAARTLIVTGGPRGSLVFDRSGAVMETPALAVNVVDRVGAGDAFFAVAAPCVFRDFAPDVVGFVGNCVGALKVAVVCNREPIDPITLFKFIQHLLK